LHRSSFILTSRAFVAAVLAIVLGIALPFLAFNLWQDDFGLFWSQGEKRIWTLEKTSKYLLSFRYIPRNFDGLLIGPSLSDGYMDTKRIAGYRIYNLSMEGGNATELRAAANNAIGRGRMRVIIICLSPYITLNSGMKGPQIDPKEYWGSLFSWLPITILQTKLQIRAGKTQDSFQGSEWGMGVRPRRAVRTWDEFAEYQLKTPIDGLKIDHTAYAQLQDIIVNARTHGAKIYAFFYPYSAWRMQAYTESGLWTAYQARTLALFDRTKDVVWDMNEAAYDPLRRDAACYTDGHLSAAGAAVVLAEIQRKLNGSPGTAETPPFGDPHALACLGRPGAGSGFDRQVTHQ
jgi:hypothetical protein